MRLGYAVGSKETIAAMAPHASCPTRTRPSSRPRSRASRTPTSSPPEQGPERHAELAGLRAREAGLPDDALRGQFRHGGRGRRRHTVIQAFREKKILVGRKFPSLPNWLRVTVGKREEVAAFLAVLPEIVPTPAAAA